MQFFNFIFLARSWASDRHYLVKELATIGRQAEQADIPLTFILYPEGTLVSKDTRPISKKYADKIGIVSGATSCFLVLTHERRPRYTARHGTHPPSEIDWPALQPQGLVTADTEFATHRHHCRIPRSVLVYAASYAVCASSRSSCRHSALGIRPSILHTPFHLFGSRTPSSCSYTSHVRLLVWLTSRPQSRLLSFMFALLSVLL